MTTFKRISLILLATIVSLLVIGGDGVVAFGLAFTSSENYSAMLVAMILLACAFDLPGIVLSLWRPRLGIILVAFGIVGTVMYEVYFFIHRGEWPSAKIVGQDLCFLGLKAVLVGLIVLLSRGGRPQRATC
jgi:hypothetical protein